MQRPSTLANPRVFKFLFVNTLCTVWSLFKQIKLGYGNQTAKVCDPDPEQNGGQIFVQVLILCKLESESLAPNAKLKRPRVLGLFWILRISNKYGSVTALKQWPN
jgi:hypothetical protein